MSENDKPVLIYSTFPSLEAAETIGSALVDQRLAACVNLLQGMISIYLWEGERHRDSETVMIVKTRTELSERVMAEIRSRHPFTNPALLVVPLAGGSDDFLAWISTQTAGRN